MKRHRGVIITKELRYTGIIIGPPRAVRVAIERVGCSWQYDHPTKTYRVPLQRLADVEACLTVDGFRVEIRGGALL